MTISRDYFTIKNTNYALKEKLMSTYFTNNISQRSSVVKLAHYGCSFFRTRRIFYWIYERVLQNKLNRDLKIKWCFFLLHSTFQLNGTATSCNIEISKFRKREHLPEVLQVDEGFQVAMSDGLMPYQDHVQPTQYKLNKVLLTKKLWTNPLKTKTSKNKT